MIITKKWLTACLLDDGKMETRIYREQMEDGGVRTFEFEVATEGQLHQWPAIICHECGALFPSIIVNDKPVLPHHSNCKNG